MARALSFSTRLSASFGLVGVVLATPWSTQAQAQETALQEQTIARAREILAPWIEEYPGLAVAVTHGDSIVWTAGFGMANLEAGTPATPTTRFNVYSVAKMLTGVAAARLAQEGHLDLDQPVREILLDLPDHYGDVTSRQLVSHLGGVRHYGRGGDWGRFGAMHCREPADAVRHFVRRPLVGPPGEQRHYSTYGFVLLSAVIGARSPQGSYLQYMTEAVFEPAGMVDTRLDTADSPSSDEAVPYRREDDGFEPIPDIDASCKFGGGGFLSSALDLARFGRALYSGALLAPEWLEVATTSATLPGGETTYYAFGADANTSDISGQSVRWVRHSGGSPGGRGYVVVLLSEDLAVGMAGNLEGEGLRLAATGLAYLFAGLEPSR